MASRSLISSELLDQIENEVIKPSVDGLVKDDLDFKGFLYAGLMLTVTALRFSSTIVDLETRSTSRSALIKGDFASYLMDGAKEILITL